MHFHHSHICKLLNDHSLLESETVGGQFGSGLPCDPTRLKVLFSNTTPSGRLSLMVKASAIFAHTFLNSKENLTMLSIVQLSSHMISLMMMMSGDLEYKHVNVAAPVLLFSASQYSDGRTPVTTHVFTQILLLAYCFICNTHCTSNTQLVSGAKSLLSIDHP